MDDNAKQHPEESPQSKVLLSRLGAELTGSVNMSLLLQSGIHTLDLTKADPETRKVLQLADKLSQTLDCISIVMQALTSQCDADASLRGMLKNVYLDDVRCRLLGCSIRNCEAMKKSGRDIEFF